MKNIFFIIILTIAFHGLAAGSSPPAIRLSPEVWNLDQVPAGSVFSKTFRIYNNGENPLLIEKIRSSCSCTTTQISTGEVLAGSSVSFEASFKTTNLSGEVKRKIYIHSDDPQQPITTIKIIAEVFQKPVARAYVFYSPSCVKCLAINKLIPQLQKKYPLEIKYFDIEEYENYEKLVQLEEEYKVSKSGLPEIFIADQALVGKKEIEEKFEEKIKSIINLGGSSWPENVKENREEDVVVKRFKSFNQLAVLSAGLIDGINPCAFTTAIFFISFLGFIGKGRREIILIGAFFTFSVFITYLFIGLGVFNFLRGIGNFAWISRGINFAVGSFAILLGGINLYDYYKFKIGKHSKIVLQLPDRIKKVIHSVIRTNMNSSSLIFAALITGFFVTLLESVCTGQVYLPTILCVLRTPGLQSQAFLYLVIYNLMFIAPLALIFGLTFFGITSNHFSNVISKNLGIIKLINSLFFFIIGFILIIYFLIATP